MVGEYERWSFAGVGFACRFEEIGISGISMGHICPEPMLPALIVLESCPGILRAGLVADHIRTVMAADVRAKDIKKSLSGGEIRISSIKRVEPTLEDVFLALADAW